MRLRIHLLSDSAFGRGDGIAGLLNSEVEHDALTGLPFIKGRTVKGLLVEACADLLYALTIGGNPALADFNTAAHKLFGVPGSRLEDTGCLHIGSALLADDLRQHLHAIQTYTPQQVLQAFTAVRHQTAVDAEQGKPLDGTLRATRVVVRNTVFYAQLHSEQALTSTDEQLLAACAHAVKRGGQNRTRGLGALAVTLTDVSGDPLAAFIQQIGGAV